MAAMVQGLINNDSVARMNLGYNKFDKVVDISISNSLTVSLESGSMTIP
jgi:hypothetical protein